MPQIVPPLFGRMSHKYLLAGDQEPMYVTVGIGFETAPINLLTVVDGCHDAMQLVHAQRGSSLYTLTETSIAYTASAGSSPLVATVNQPTPGGNAGDAFPSNTAFLLKKLSGFGGRTNQGRMFYPGVPEGNVDPLGQVGNDVKVSWNSQMAAYLLSIENLNSVLGLFIFHSGPAGVPGEAPTRITQIVCDARVATQRQRLRR